MTPPPAAPTPSDRGDAERLAARSSAPEVVIGLDLGTTAAKATAYEVGGGRGAVAEREYPLLEPEPGWQVQDPETMVEGALGALREVVEQTPAGSVLALSCSTAMHGLIGLDERMKPLTPLLTWADARASGIAQELLGTDEGHELHRRSGTPIHPMSPLTKLIWFERNDPDLFGRVRWWVGLKDYLLWRLTGELVTELSCASGTGLLDLQARDWSDETLRRIGVRRDQLPPVRPTIDSLRLGSSVAARIGLPSGTPVVLGAGDGPLGNLGTGALRPGVAGLSLGTSGALRTVVPEPGVDERCALFCYALTDQDWVVGGPVSNGGIVMRWALDLVGQDLLRQGSGSADAKLVELAGSVPAGSEGLVMIPYLLAERAPLWDPSLPGSILGLRRHHTRGHLVRAAMEGVALQLAAIVDRLEELRPVTTVRATGGVFRAPLWGKVIGAVLDRPTYLMAASEGSSLGAAALGAYAIGRAPTLGTALDLLSPGIMTAGEPVEVDPADVETYARLRRSVPDLLEAQQRLAGAFTPR